MPEPGGRVGSVGWRVQVGRPWSGSVHSVFPRAVNCIVGGEPWVVLDAAAPDAPYGLRLEGAIMPGQLGVGPGDPVCSRAGYLALGPAVLDCRSASRWAPEPLEALNRGWAGRLAQVGRQAGATAWAGSADLAAALVDALLDRSHPQALQAAIDSTVGRGPGLTPAGDDVLVGLFAGLSLGGASDDHYAGDGRRVFHSRLAGAWAATPSRTNDISDSILDQACAGWFGAALHGLLRAVTRSDAEAVRRAVSALLAVGASSGADTCVGVAACAPLLAGLIAEGRQA